MKKIQSNGMEVYDLGGNLCLMSVTVEQFGDAVIVHAPTHTSVPTTIPAKA